MTRSLYLILLVAVIALNGCATTKSLRQADKQRLQNVYIAPENVKYKPTKDLIYLNTSTKAWATVLGGPVGALIYEAADDHEPEAIIYNHLNSDDMLKRTVAESFKYQFEETGLFEITQENVADAYLEIEVMDVQFHEINGDDLRYTGLYFARLYDSRSKEMVWAQHDFFSAFNGDLIEYTLEEYVSDPAKLRYAASVVSQMLAIEFIEDLGGNPVGVNHSLHSVDNYEGVSIKRESNNKNSIRVAKEKHNESETVE